MRTGLLFAAFATFECAPDRTRKNNNPTRSHHTPSPCACRPNSGDDVLIDEGRSASSILRQLQRLTHLLKKGKQRDDVARMTRIGTYRVGTLAKRLTSSAASTSS